MGLKLWSKDLIPASAGKHSCTCESARNPITKFLLSSLSLPRNQPCPSVLEPFLWSVPLPCPGLGSVEQGCALLGLVPFHPSRVSWAGGVREGKEHQPQPLSLSSSRTHPPILSQKSATGCIVPRPPAASAACVLPAVSLWAQGFPFHRTCSWTPSVSPPPPGPLGLPDSLPESTPCL